MFDAQHCRWRAALGSRGRVLRGGAAVMVAGVRREPRAELPRGVFRCRLHVWPFLACRRHRHFWLQIGVLVLAPRQRNAWRKH
jgi:hypothetical protein